MMYNLNIFIQHVYQECSQNGVKLILAPTSKIDKCRGYFDEHKKKLVVAVDNPLNIWIQVLVHEYAHLTQYLEKHPIYTKVRVDIDTWLNHNRKHEKTLINIKEMELDCERRGLKIVDKFGLPINRVDYCRRASSYIHYYNYMLLNPKWCKVAPYEIPEIFNQMPTTLRGKYDKLGKFEDVYRKFYDI